MFDGFTRSSMYYGRLYASYTIDVSQREHFSCTVKSVNRLMLICLYPLGQEVNRDDSVNDATQETRKLKAKSHMAYFTDPFQIVGKSNSYWCV